MGLKELGLLLSRLNDPTISIEYFNEWLTVKDIDIKAEAHLNMYENTVFYQFNGNKSVSEEKILWFFNIVNGIRRVIDVVTNKKTVNMVTEEELLKFATKETEGEE